VDLVTEVFKKQQLDADGVIEGFEEEELPPPIIVAHNQYC
jgi:hypothetical protein